MITYRDSDREEDTDALLGRALRLAREGDALSLVAEAGVLEQAVLDALRPARDGWSTVEAALRDAVLRAGEAYLAAWEGRPAAAPLRRAEEALRKLRGASLPSPVRARSPEGYAHYALDPAGYAAAARAYAAEAGAGRAGRAVVVGVRSIGTSLSAVVAAAVGSGRSFTVRPRGETGGRHVAADGALEARLAALLADGGDVLVVDEGPGATGETLRCVAGWLRARGVAEERIVLLPSHTGGMSLAPEERRAWFAGARTFPPPPDGGRGARVAAGLGLGEPEDLSGGRWRAVVPGAAEEPACVGHERLKYRARDSRGGAWLVRYAGLGRWGRGAEERAALLAEAGVGPEVLGAADGFLARRWVEGRVAGPDALRDPRFAEALGRYLAARAGRFGTGEAVDAAPLAELLRENAREALGDGVRGVDGAVRLLERLPERPAVISDARLALREWIRTPEGYVKVDALDHGDGTRFPGPTDAAWDVAGAAVEYGLDGASLSTLVRRVSAASGESTRELEAAVAAYRAPYAASCLGHTTLSAWEAPDPAERARWEAEAARYARLLRRELERAA